MCGSKMEPKPAAARLTPQLLVLTGPRGDSGSPVEASITCESWGLRGGPFVGRRPSLGAAKDATLKLAESGKFCPILLVYHPTGLFPGNSDFITK
jgi:hypothetical protein